MANSYGSINDRRYIFKGKWASSDGSKRVVIENDNMTRQGRDIEDITTQPQFGGKIPIVHSLEITRHHGTNLGELENTYLKNC